MGSRVVDADPRLQARGRGLALLPKLSIGLLLFGSLVSPASAAVDCDDPQGDSERMLCRLGDLRTWDDELNMIYRMRMRRMEEAGKARLRGEQRAWIKARNAECNVNPKLKAHEWLEEVARDASRAECVIRMTRERTQALRDDRRHEYDLVQRVRQSDQDIVFSVRVHPLLPRSIFRVVWQAGGAGVQDRGKLIDRIEVSREGEAKRIQLLTGPIELNEIIYTPADVLQADDVNFDGYLDVGILIGQGATGNERWAYWLYNPQTGKFEAREDLVFGNPFFDPKTKTIHTGAKCGGGCYESATYIWRDGKPVLIDQKVEKEEPEDP